MTLKTKFFFLILALTGLVSCETSQIKHAPMPEAGMFRVAILYPNGKGKTFDMDYYEKKHMPMVAGFLGENLDFYEIDKGIAGRMPTDEVPFLAIGSFYVKDVAEYNKTIVQNKDAIISDFKNYTNIQPTVQVNEVKRWVYPDTR